MPRSLNRLRAASRTTSESSATPVVPAGSRRPVSIAGPHHVHAIKACSTVSSSAFGERTLAGVEPMDVRRWVADLDNAATRRQRSARHSRSCPAPFVSPSPTGSSPVPRAGKSSSQRSRPRSGVSCRPARSRNSPTPSKPATALWCSPAPTPVFASENWRHSASTTSIASANLAR